MLVIAVDSWAARYSQVRAFSMQSAVPMNPALKLGATSLSSSGENWRVYADPAGKSAGTSQVVIPVRWRKPRSSPYPSGTDYWPL